MRQFSYVRAENATQAVNAKATQANAFLAGGSTLIDLVKLDVMQPDTLVDINSLPLYDIEKLKDGRLKIGALVTNNDLAWHPEVKARYAVLSEALLSGASTSLRNKATTGGNVMQKVRCPYYRDGVSPCNKRAPGSGCSAIEGNNRSVHAVLGTSEHCIASHPSDMCVAMAAIGATILVSGPKGEREIPFTDFHLLPGSSPDKEHDLAPGELITHVILDKPLPDNRSHYLKLRDRASYQFALASSAVIVSLSGSTISNARIAMGGVGTKPWRAFEAEQSLKGKTPSQAAFEKAAAIAFAAAKPQSQNGFKIPLGQQAVVRSLKTITAQEDTMTIDLNASDIMGAALPRVDGPDKLTGRAKYSADNHLPGMLYGYGVYSTIAKGKITSLDTSAARQMPGVVDVFHHNHFTDKLYHVPANMAKGLKVDESRLPFEDDTIYYAGQLVAYVVANSFAKAREAALKVKVTYSEAQSVTSIKQARAAGVSPIEQKPSEKSRGDAEAAYTQSAHKHEAVYTTPFETHNPMEMHATAAQWEDGKLVVYEATQGVTFSRNTLARVFGLVPENVVVRTPFLGSGFGGKLFTWPHCIATAAISREVGKPVHFMVPRAQMFTTTGHRSATEQTFKISADTEGNLTSMTQHTLNSTSEIDIRVETAGRTAPIFYKCPNVDIANSVIQMNTGSPAAMRAPGAAPGIFALESAMDELAVAMNMDPLTLRRKNFTDRNQVEDLPWSDTNILEAYDKGAAKFGWDKRNPKPGSMRDGKDILGWGVAACAWDAMKSSSKARVSFLANGKVRVSCAVQDIGTGTYNVMAQTVSAATGIPVEKVEVKIGDSDLVAGPLSGGSWATASLLPAVKQACENAISELKTYAVMDKSPFAGESEEYLTFKNGQLSSQSGTARSFSDILKAIKAGSAEGEGSTDGAMKEGYSSRVFGAHFVEIRWDPEIADLRVSRVVSAIDVGKIVNHKTAANQVEGAIVMGIGMAMFEHTEYDERTGRPVNNNIAEYLMPVHGDMPDELEVIFLDKPDYNFSEVGAKGLGEIGITGLAAAIANAVYHATGKRVRELPITLEKLM